MKKVVAILIAALMVIGIAACGNSSTAETTAEETKATEAPAETTAAPEETTAAPATEATEAPAEGSFEGSIRIGVLIPITGSFAATGTTCNDGLNMAIDEINAAGGINGMKIEVFFEDTGTDASTAINAANRLISNDVDLIMGPPISTQCTAVATVAAENQIPLLIRGVSTDLSLGEGWMFRFCSNDKIETGGTVQFAYNRGYKKIGLIHSNDEFGMNAAENAKGYIAKYDDMEIVAEETFNTTDSDMTPQLLKLYGAGCDCVLHYGSGEGNVYVMQQRLNVGFTSDFPWIGTGNLYDPDSLSLMSAQEVEGVYVLMNSIYLGSEDQRAIDFAENFKNLYGYDAGQNSAIYYDGAYVVAEAVKNAGGDLSGEALKAGLNAIKDYQGIAAIYTTQPDGEMATVAEVITFVNKEVSLVEILNVEV